MKILFVFPLLCSPQLFSKFSSLAEVPVKPVLNQSNLSSRFFVQSFAKKLKSRTNGNLQKKRKGSNKGSIKSKKVDFADQTEEKSCNDSGKSQKTFKTHIVKSTAMFPEKRLNKLIDYHLSYIKKGWPRQCPTHCEQVNNYNMLSKFSPIDIVKGSCKKEESKEIYSFDKKFSFQQNDQSIKQAHKDMTKWVLATFVYPYLPIPFLPKPTKESIEHNIGEACPSCSFYLDYNYRYAEDNHLDFHITASCRDRRKTLSNFKLDFTLENHWSCKQPNNKVSNKKRDDLS